MEKDPDELETLFQHIIGNMKFSYPVWEELVGRASKLHTALRYTVAALIGFLETFQKLSDYALGTKGGGTKEIGSSLTRLCFRHKAIENRLKLLTNALMEALILPLQEQIESWKKTVVQVDRDHARDLKKAQQTVKKASTDTIKLRKKVDKGKSERRGQLEIAMEDLNAKHASLEALEHDAVKMAMSLERQHFCFLITCLQPIMEQEIGMLSEVTNLQDIVSNLCILSQDASCIPDSAVRTIYESSSCANLLPHSSLDHKKRLLEGENLSDRSASSSTGSIHNSVDSLSSSNVLANPPPLEGGVSPSLSGNAGHASSGQGPSIADIPLPFDRPHTISSSVYQHGHARPHLSTDTFEPLPHSSSNGSDIGGMKNVTSVTTPKVADIYARPALVIGKDARATPLAVATPKVPVTNVTTSPVVLTVSQQVLAKSQLGSSSVERISVMPSSAAEQKQSLRPDMSDLAAAIRDLEANTAALQSPFSEFQAPSCQSLQCSSGYGTMTNISMGTACSQETISSSASDFDTLADALLQSDLTLVDKYCTLPTKRAPSSAKTSTAPSTVVRPASTTGLKVKCAENVPQPYQGESFIASDLKHAVNSGTSASSCKTASEYAVPVTKYVDCVPNVDGYAGDQVNMPLPTILHHHNDSDDDFPLPPPPDLDSFPSMVTKEESNGAPVMLLVTSNSAQITHSLNVKMTTRNSIVGPTKAPPPVAAKTFRRSSVEQLPLVAHHDVYSAPTAAAVTLSEESGSNMLLQIQRGVSLRRTVSNDRSAPRVASLK